MTHEPECISYDGGHTCICDIIQPAYQRGREDAIKDAATRVRKLFVVDGHILESYLRIRDAQFIVDAIYDDNSDKNLDSEQTITKGMKDAHPYT